jgi:hypothetical protein
MIREFAMITVNSLMVLFSLMKEGNLVICKTMGIYRGHYDK